MFKNQESRIKRWWWKEMLKQSSRGDMVAVLGVISMILSPILATIRESYWSVNYPTPKGRGLPASRTQARSR